jgi:hypothetical protein
LISSAICHKKALKPWGESVHEVRRPFFIFLVSFFSILTPGKDAAADDWMELGGVTGFEVLTVYANPFDPAADVTRLTLRDWCSAG